MSIKLQREHINLSEILSSRTMQTTAQGDIIVPDIKPDILKVLGVSGEAIINRKDIQTDKVYLGGIVRLNILYIPDGDVLGKVKSINTTLDFSHDIDVKGAKPNMNLMTEAECESIEYTLINSRKLNVRGKIGLNIKITVPVEADIATDVDDDAAVQIKGTHLKVSSAVCSAERDIVIREQLEIGEGMPHLGEILRFLAKPTLSELKASDGKAILKGDISFSTLYCGEDEEASIRFQEHTAGFSEVIEVGGLTEGMDLDAELFVKDIYFEIRTDSDGDRRIIGAEVTVCLCLWASETVELDAIGDAFGLKDELVLEKKAFNIEQLIGNVSSQLTLKEIMRIPDYLPNVYQVCDCNIVPAIEGIAIEDGCIAISGNLSCSLLYLSEGDSPVATMAHILPFNHTFEITGIDKDSVCDAKADIEHLSYTIAGDKEIELRIIVALSLKAVSPNEAVLIDNISIDTDAEGKKLPSMIIYFVQSGDTLWDIAKRYKTTPDAIIANNGQEKEILKPGNQIYIFR